MPMLKTLSAVESVSRQLGQFKLGMGIFTKSVLRISFSLALCFVLQNIMITGWLRQILDG
jgi:hypothetical protein